MSKSISQLEYEQLVRKALQGERKLILSIIDNIPPYASAAMFKNAVTTFIRERLEERKDVIPTVGDLHE